MRGVQYLLVTLLINATLFNAASSYLGWRRRRSSCDTVTGGWSGWSVWSKCTCTDNVASKERYRYCTAPAPSCGGRVCHGYSEETSSCLDLAVQGGWSDWGPFSGCQCVLEGELKTKERQCDNPSPSCGGRTCEGAASYSEKCAIDGGWSRWGNWNTCQCDHSTGTGTRNRTRTCTNPVPSCLGRECVGEDVQFEQCNEECCKTVDGSWSSWDSWSTCECDHSTGTGTRNRTRTCTNPIPSCFGRSCDGDTIETDSCDDQCCVSVDGVWTVWGPWSDTCQCDHLTGDGQMVRSRTCSNPAPSCYGSECMGEKQEVKVCSDQCCKLVDGGWSVWGEWSTTCLCDHVTGTGHLHRNRSCSLPPPDCGGKPCEGSPVQTRDCSTSCCKSINGSWSSWDSWSTCECDHSTGTGTRNRTRSCTNPIPSCLGRQCAGEDQESISCNEHCCKTVDGSWSSWDSWSTCECNHSTGTGTRNRTRTCSNPPASCLGRMCEGDSSAVEVCNDQCCRTMNGGWSSWDSWSTCECDHSTGTGTRNRTRSCTNPIPSCLGSGCAGETAEISACDESCGEVEPSEEVIICDPFLCDRKSTCNLEECFGDEEGSSNAVIGEECGLNDIQIAGTCLAMYIVGIIAGVLLLAVVGIGLFIIRRRRSKNTETPYVIENVHRIENEDFNEGTLTLSDTEVNFKTTCCGGEGDYHIFTDEFYQGSEADENNYVERKNQVKRKRPLSAYVTAYNTSDNGPGPSNLTYENQAETCSSYENQTSCSSYENQGIGRAKNSYENSEKVCQPVAISAYENQENAGPRHYEDMSQPQVAGGDEETREEEHHYSEIRGSVGIYQKRTKGALSSREQVYEEKCVGEQEQSEDYLYDDPDHIYFNPDFDKI